MLKILEQTELCTHILNKKYPIFVASFTSVEVNASRSPRQLHDTFEAQFAPTRYSDTTRLTYSGFGQRWAM